MRVKCVAAPNAAGTHLPSVKYEMLTDVLKKKGPIKWIAVILAIIICGGLCPIATAKSKLLLRQNTTFISHAPRSNVHSSRHRPSGIKWYLESINECMTWVMASNHANVTAVKIFDCFSFSCTLYILPFIYIYIKFWHVLYPLSYGPMYLDLMNKKVSK